MRPLRCGAVLAVLATAGVPAALAWTPATRVRMADEAVRFMPDALRLALETHRESLLRGALEPLTEEGALSHLPPGGGGTLDAEIAERFDALVDAVRTGARFREIARRFGGLMHFVADAGFPPNSSGASGASRYENFGQFCESRLERFPLVFYGHDSPQIERGDLRAFSLDVLRRARDEDRDLARAYAAAGDPPDPAAFDDRSVPFAVGSLSWSWTVTHVVRVWLAAWEKAGGDLDRTPYRHQPSGGKP